MNIFKHLFKKKAKIEPDKYLDSDIIEVSRMAEKIRQTNPKIKSYESLKIAASIFHSQSLHGNNNKLIEMLKENTIKETEVSSKIYLSERGINRTIEKIARIMYEYIDKKPDIFNNKK